MKKALILALVGLATRCSVQKPPLTYESVTRPELAELRNQSHAPLSPEYTKAARAYERERRDGEEAERAAG